MTDDFNMIEEVSSNYHLISLENVHNLFCGSSLLAIIDKEGRLYLYNEQENLYKVKLENKIQSIKFVENNFYALTREKNILYEFTNKSTKFLIKNYIENYYIVNQNVSIKLNLIELPYYTNLLFFLVECMPQIKEEIQRGKRKIFNQIKYNKQNSNNTTTDDRLFFSDEENNSSRIKTSLHTISKGTSSRGLIKTEDNKSKIRTESLSDFKSKISVYPPNNSFKKNNSRETVRSSEKYNSNNSRIGKISDLLGHIFDNKINQINSQLSFAESNILPNGKRRIQLERVGNNNNDRILNTFTDYKKFSQCNSESEIQYNYDDDLQELNCDVDLIIRDSNYNKINDIVIKDYITKDRKNFNNLAPTFINNFNDISKKLDFNLDENSLLKSELKDNSEFQSSRTEAKNMFDFSLLKICKQNEISDNNITMNESRRKSIDILSNNQKINQINLSIISNNKNNSMIENSFNIFPTNANELNSIITARESFINKKNIIESNNFNICNVSNGRPNLTINEEFGFIKEVKVNHFTVEREMKHSLINETQKEYELSEDSTPKVFKMNNNINFSDYNLTKERYEEKEIINENLENNNHPINKILNGSNIESINQDKNSSFNISEKNENSINPIIYKKTKVIDNIKLKNILHNKKSFAHSPISQTVTSAIINDSLQVELEGDITPTHFKSKNIFIEDLNGLSINEQYQINPKLIKNQRPISIENKITNDSSNLNNNNFSNCSNIFNKKLITSNLSKNKASNIFSVRNLKNNPPMKIINIISPDKQNIIRENKPSRLENQILSKNEEIVSQSQNDNYINNGTFIDLQNDKIELEKIEQTNGHPELIQLNTSIKNEIIDQEMEIISLSVLNDKEPEIITIEEIYSESQKVIVSEINSDILNKTEEVKAYNDDNLKLDSDLLSKDILQENSENIFNKPIRQKDLKDVLEYDEMNLEKSDQQNLYPCALEIIEIEFDEIIKSSNPNLNITKEDKPLENKLNKELFNFENEGKLDEQNLNDKLKEKEDDIEESSNVEFNNNIIKNEDENNLFIINDDTLKDIDIIINDDKIENITNNFEYPEYKNEVNITKEINEENLVNYLKENQQILILNTFPRVENNLSIEESPKRVQHSNKIKSYDNSYCDNLSKSNPYKRSISSKHKINEEEVNDKNKENPISIIIENKINKIQEKINKVLNKNNNKNETTDNYIKDDKEVNINFVEPETVIETKHILDENKTKIIIPNKEKVNLESKELFQENEELHFHKRTFSYEPIFRKQNENSIYDLIENLTQSVDIKSLKKTDRDLNKLNEEINRKYIFDKNKSLELTPNKIQNILINENMNTKQNLNSNQQINFDDNTKVINIENKMQGDIEEEEDMIYYYITEVDDLTEIAEVDEMNESEHQSQRQKTESAKKRPSQSHKGLIKNIKAKNKREIINLSNENNKNNILNRKSLNSKNTKKSEESYESPKMKNVENATQNKEIAKKNLFSNLIKAIKSSGIDSNKEIIKYDINKEEFDSKNPFTYRNIRRSNLDNISEEEEDNLTSKGVSPKMNNEDEIKFKMTADDVDDFEIKFNSSQNNNPHFRSQSMENQVMSNSLNDRLEQFKKTNNKNVEIKDKNIIIKESELNEINRDQNNLKIQENFDDEINNFRIIKDSPNLINLHTESLINKDETINLDQENCNFEISDLLYTQNSLAEEDQNSPLIKFSKKFRDANKNPLLIKEGSEHSMSQRKMNPFSLINSFEGILTCQDDTPMMTNASERSKKYTTSRRHSLTQKKGLQNIPSPNITNSNIRQSFSPGKILNFDYINKKSISSKTSKTNFKPVVKNENNNKIISIVKTKLITTSFPNYTKTINTEESIQKKSNPEKSLIKSLTQKNFQKKPSESNNSEKSNRSLKIIKAIKNENKSKTLSMISDSDLIHNTILPFKNKPSIMNNLNNNFRSNSKSKLSILSVVKNKDNLSKPVPIEKEFPIEFTKNESRSPKQISKSSHTVINFDDDLGNYEKKFLQTEGNFINSRKSQNKITESIPKIKNKKKFQKGHSMKNNITYALTDINEKRNNNIKEKNENQLKMELINSIEHLKEAFRNYVNSNKNIQAKESLRELIKENLALIENKRGIFITPELKSSPIRIRESKNSSFSLEDETSLIEQNLLNEEDQELIRNYATNNLENFKLTQIKEKLESYLKKIIILGNLSPKETLCLSPAKMIQDLEDKNLEFEPLELDKSQVTLRSSSISQTNRKSGIYNLNGENPSGSVSSSNRINNLQDTPKGSQTTPFKIWLENEMSRSTKTISKEQNILNLKESQSKLNQIEENLMEEIQSPIIQKIRKFTYTSEEEN